MTMISHAIHINNQKAKAWLMACWPAHTHSLSFNTRVRSFPTGHTHSLHIPPHGAVRAFSPFLSSLLSLLPLLSLPSRQSLLGTVPIRRQGTGNAARLLRYILDTGRPASRRYAYAARVRVGPGDARFKSASLLDPASLPP